MIGHSMAITTVILPTTVIPPTKVILPTKVTVHPAQNQSLKKMTIFTNCKKIDSTMAAKQINVK